ncbi:hypothetical protein HT031_004986 [Scenedesmus sp. PABB004]|nr:hypothetical protein HT031_004986 [Scenedesmus sp. PABB004]
MHPLGGGASSLALPRPALRLVARGRSALARAAGALQRTPLLAKALPTAAGWALGDVLTQHLGPLWPHAGAWPSKGDFAAHDAAKTLAMGGAGAALGAPASLALYALLDAAAPGGGAALAAAKFAADQALGCLLWQATYLAVSEPYRATLAAFLAAQQRARPPHAALAAAC